MYLFMFCVYYLLTPVERNTNRGQRELKDVSQTLLADGLPGGSSHLGSRT